MFSLFCSWIGFPTLNTCTYRQPYLDSEHTHTHTRTGEETEKQTEAEVNKDEAMNWRWKERGGVGG